MGGTGTAIGSAARTLIAFTLAIVVTSATSAGVAQDALGDEGKEAEARAMFDAGRAAFEAGRYDDALKRWESAFRLSGRPAIRYNHGLAHERLGQIDEAIAAFENYLKWDSEGARATEVRGKLQTLRSMRDASSPSPTAPEAAEPPAEPEPTPAPTPQAVAQSNAHADVRTTSPGSNVDDDGGEVLPWVLVGGGVALLLTAVWTGSVAMGAADDLEAACSSGVCPHNLRDRRDEANDYALVTDVLWIAGALSAGVGVTLLLLEGEPGDHETSLALRVGPSGAWLEGLL